MLRVFSSLSSVILPFSRLFFSWFVVCRIWERLDTSLFRLDSILSFSATFSSKTRISSLSWDTKTWLLSSDDLNNSD